MLIRLRHAETGDQSRITLTDDASHTLGDIERSVIEQLGLIADDKMICFRMEPESPILDGELPLSALNIEHGSLLYYTIDEKPPEEPVHVEPDMSDCPHCGKSILFDLMKFHIDEECTARLVECQFCSLQLSSDLMENHESQCGSRTEKCAKCDNFVTYRDYERHLATNCEFPPPNTRPDHRSAAEIEVDYIRARTLGDFFGEAPDKQKCTICDEEFSDATALQRHLLDSGHADRDTLQALALVYGEETPVVCTVAARTSDIVTSPLAPSNYDVITDIPCEVCGDSFAPDQFLEHQLQCEGSDARIDSVEPPLPRRILHHRNPHPLRTQTVPTRGPPTVTRTTMSSTRGGVTTTVSTSNFAMDDVRMNLDDVDSLQLTGEPVRISNRATRGRTRRNRP